MFHVEQPPVVEAKNCRRARKTAIANKGGKCPNEGFKVTHYWRNKPLLAEVRSERNWTPCHGAVNDGGSRIPFPFI